MLSQVNSGGRDGGFSEGGGLEIEVACRTVPRIIGRGGSKIKELEQESGARIKILKDRDNGVTTVVELQGTEDAQQHARDLIRQIEEGVNDRSSGQGFRGRRDDDQDYDQSFGSRGRGGFGGGQNRRDEGLEIEIPSRCVGRVIGKGGSKIRELEEKSGARIKIRKDRDNGVMATIELQGYEDAQQRAKQLIEALIEDGNSYGDRSGPSRDGFGFSRDAAENSDQGFGGRSGGGFGSHQNRYGDDSALEIEVPSNSVARIIGRGGSKIRELQEESGARIKIRKDKDNGVMIAIELQGSEGAQQRAKQLIEALVEDGNSYGDRS